MDKFATQLKKSFVSLLLILCIVLLGFINPVRADSLNPFVHDVKNGAGQAAEIVLTPASVCLGSFLLTPRLAPAVCFAVFSGHSNSSLDKFYRSYLGTGQVKRDSYNGEVEWVVGNEVSKM